MTEESPSPLPQKNPEPEHIRVNATRLGQPAGDDPMAAHYREATERLRKMHETIARPQKFIVTSRLVALFASLIAGFLFLYMSGNRLQRLQRFDQAKVLDTKEAFSDCKPGLYKIEGMPKPMEGKEFPMIKELKQSALVLIPMLQRKTVSGWENAAALETVKMETVPVFCLGDIQVELDPELLLHGHDLDFCPEQMGLIREPDDKQPDERVAALGLPAKKDLVTIAEIRDGHVEKNHLYFLGTEKTFLQQRATLENAWSLVQWGGRGLAWLCIFFGFFLFVRPYLALFALAPGGKKLRRMALTMLFIISGIMVLVVSLLMVVFWWIVGILLLLVAWAVLLRKKLSRNPISPFGNMGRPG